MAFDVHKNFAVSAVATAPSPATSGTSLVVTAAQGTRFPAVPFNATIWPAGVQPDPSNAEIVRVTAIGTDTLTIVRAQEGSSARTVIVTDQIAAAITAKTVTDIESLALVHSGRDFVPTVGVNTMPRACASTISGAWSAGFPTFTGFVPQTSFTAGHIKFYTAATTSPTHAYVGLYSVDASGNLTQIAVSADTVSIGTTGLRNIALTVPVGLVAGNAYAVAFLTVGATLNYGCSPSIRVEISGSVVQPFLMGYVTAGSATVLPASATFASLTMYINPMYAEITV